MPYIIGAHLFAGFSRLLVWIHSFAGFGSCGQFSNHRRRRWHSPPAVDGYTNAFVSGLGSRAALRLCNSPVDFGSRAAPLE